MKLFTLIAIILAGCGLCGNRAAAQSTNAVATTNAVLTTTLNLTAYIQQTNNGLPSVKIQKFATKDIIAAYANDLGKTADQLARAKFMFRLSNLGNTNEDVSLYPILRMSSGDTNIVGAFGLDLAKFESVKTVRSNSQNGTSIETDYFLFTLQVITTNLTVEAQGQLKLGVASVTAGRTVIDPRVFPTSYAMSLTGSGKVGTNTAVFSGTLTANNRKLE